MTDKAFYRQQLLDFFSAGIAAVKGDTAVSTYLAQAGFDRQCEVVAIGKAASSMLQGAFRSLPNRIDRALLITKHNHVDEELRQAQIPLEIIESSHPLPDNDSLYAGTRLLHFIAQAPADSHLLVLISGGTSSLVEVLPEGMDLSALQHLNSVLLASGMAIGDMNRVRKSVSCIKGGRLAQFIGTRSVSCLLVSDVPGDRVADIGSGLLCREVSRAVDNLPAALGDFIQTASAQSVASETWQQIDTHIVASLSHAKQAAAAAAKAAGYAVTIEHRFVEGDATQAGEQIAQSLISAAPGILIAGGETTMLLPDNPGRGGRNQHFALSAAAQLRGVEGCFLLCAGTDGTDGPTHAAGHAAGGLVDGDTIALGTKNGKDWQAALAAADSGNFLAAADALLTTGPTGTNVMDLMIGLKL